MKARTRVRVLRRVGIALIAVPEPVTTPFGVALLLASRYMSGRLEAKQNSRLRETVKSYLAHTGHLRGYADAQPGTPGPVTHYALSEEHAILGQITGGLSSEANLAPSVWRNWQDMRRRTVHDATDAQDARGKAVVTSRATPVWSDASQRVGKVVRHSIDERKLCERYEGAGSAVACSNHLRPSGVVDGATHHSINMGLLSEHYDTVNLSRAKVKRHAIDKALLLRHSAPVNHGTVRSALRTNNHYYDLVSRSNVIGGYPCSVPNFVGPSTDSSGKNNTAKDRRENSPRLRYAFMAT